MSCWPDRHMQFLFTGDFLPFSRDRILPHSQTERIEFCRKINHIIVPFESFTSREKFIFLMSTNDTEVLMLLVHFIDKCLQIQQSSGR